MMNLSLDELRLIAKIRNISDYQNKSKEDLIKAVSEPEPDTKTKPDTKSNPEPEREPKIEMKFNRSRLKKLRKDFDELSHKFSKTEIDEYRKAFYIAKNYKNLSESKIEKINKNFNKLKKALNLKNFVVILIASVMKILIIMMIIIILQMMINTEIGAIRTLFKEFDRDYYKPNQ